jgi:hypothetical protein
MGVALGERVEDDRRYMAWGPLLILEKSTDGTTGIHLLNTFKTGNNHALS